MHLHFDQKDSISHVVEKRAKGITALSESHGTEMPGHISAGADSARDTSIVMAFFWLFSQVLNAPKEVAIWTLLSLSFGWIAWKAARSAWLGWARLERLHKIIEQEKYEIENHRSQEREELRALYKAKGFEGRLLEEVLDVLMSDQDRLLKVMLEEELGLALEIYEHPLKQCFGALIGSTSAVIISGLFFYLAPQYGMPIASLLVMGASAFAAAHYEKNELLPAVVWNLAIGSLAYGIAYFFLQIFKPLAI